MITTDFDFMFGRIKERKELYVHDLIRFMKKKHEVEKEDAERYLRVLTEVGVVEISYSKSLFGRDRVILLNPHLERSLMVDVKINENEKILDEYTITIEDSRADVKIISSKEEAGHVYTIFPNDIGEGTQWFLEYVTKQVPGLLNIVREEEAVSFRLSDTARKQLVMKVGEIIERTIPKEDLNKKTILSHTLVRNLVGFGIIDFMIEDENLEEVVFQGVTNPVIVYHRKYMWIKTNVWIKKEKYIFNIAERIGRKISRTINVLDPILDAYLQSGERVNAILFPISAQGNTITIRKFKKNPWTIINLLETKTLNKDIAAFLWLCIQYELNILIAGGTASGKTSFLNAMCQFLPVNQHIVTIEEIEELTLPKYFRWNWVPLLERKSVGGKGEVSLLDLMVTSLRMRPDRIIVGEVRRPREAEVLFEAMHTGHSAYGTIHADNSYQVYRRLIDAPFSIPPLELEALHLVVVQRRDRRTGGRRTYEIAEVEIPETFKESEFSMSILYRWDSKIDEILPLNKPQRILEELYFNTGMDENEINKNLENKKEVLDWMLKNNIKLVDDVGKVMSVYYKDPDFLLNVVKNNDSSDKILKY